LPITTSPIFSPSGGAYSTGQSVSITSGSAGAAIYFTTNGTPPTTSSNVYTGPVAVNASETLEAIAVASGYSPSAVGTAIYSIGPILPTPTFSPVQGTYTTPQAVTIFESTPGGSIYYTTNGTTPTTSSSLYSAPITVSANETLQAIAAGTGYNNSAVAAAAYAIAPVLAAPTFSPVGGTYSTPQTVTISDLTPGVTIYFTTNGTTPTTSSTIYTGPINVSWNQTVQAIAVGAGYTGSVLATASYTIDIVGTTYVNYPNGGFTASSLSLNYGATVTGGLLQLTDGGTGENRTAWFATRVPVQNFVTDFTFQQLNAAADGMTFTIQNDNVWALGGAGGGLGYQGITQSVAVKFDIYNNAGEGNDSTGLYTDGAAPTEPATDLSSTGINLRSGDLMHAHMVYDGTNLTMTLTDTVTNATVTEVFPVNIPSIVGSNTAWAGFTGGTGGGASTQNVLSWTYVVPSAAFTAAPSFSPAAGTYATSQTVTISDSTPGATIYYTSNGTTPTTSSSVYSSPLTVSASETLEAIAVASEYTNSPVATAAYTIASVLPTPTFSPAAGTYTTSQTVTISDSTSGATIYYTTNGTTPTTSSSVYSGPITVSASETLEAIAVETGYTTSQAATAAYTITPVLPAPTFSPVAGSYTTSQTVTISDSTAGTTIYYTTNGTTPTTSSSVYSAPVTVSASETLEAIAVKTGYTNSSVATAAYVIAPILPAPTFLPAGGTYATSQSVTISDSTAGTTIYYTTNGTTPTTSSSVYNSPITVSTSETLKAIAVEAGYTNSSVATATYTIGMALPAPTFSPVGGTYSTPQSVTISDSTAGSTIYYTTNGTTPTTSSSVYSSPITVSASETLEAIAVEAGYTNSPVVSAAYTIGAGGTTYINYPNAGFTASSLSLNYGATVTGGLLQLTDGGTGENRTAWFATQVPVQNFVTDFTFQQLNAAADGMTFTIQNDNVWALGGAGGGLGYQGIPQSVAVKFDIYNNVSEGNDSTGLYTNGAAPTVPAVNLSSTGIVLLSGDLMHAHMVYDGTNLTMTLTDTVTNATVTEAFPVNISSIVGSNTAWVGFTGGTGGSSAVQNVLSWTFVSPAGSVAATPTFSPAGGTYATSQTVTISDSTPGATIYYTSNGTTPTTSSSVYSSPLTVSASETLEAIAVASGESNSSTGTSTYTIAPALPAPTFSPAAGTYTTSQTVTISDSTSGTTIYYTTNGTTPTTSSSVYSGPITVSASETLEAIAVETGYTNSPAATAAYTITPVLPAPTFSPVAGSYTTSQTVTISDSTAGTTIYYTTNGTTPTTSSSVYSAPVTVSASETLEAIAVKTGYTNSSVATAAYVIAPILPAPTFLPAGGTYATSQSVTISDSTAGTTIYYTTNGTTPTISSSVYSSPITVSASETLEAIAVEAGYTNSSVVTAAYTIGMALPAPTFSPAGGTYAASQSVTISDSTAGATIYYTTNGTAPTTSSSVYSSPITVSASETLEAIAVEAGYTNSSVVTAAYTIGTGGTTYVNYPNGGFTASSLSLNYGATVTGGLLQLTDGGTGENRTAWFATRVPVQNFVTDFTFQQLNAAADGMTFTIQNDNVWALGGAGAGLGYQGIPDSVAVKFDIYNNVSEGADSTGLYTNGAAPTVPAVNLSSTGIVLLIGDLMHAHMVYDGTNLTMTLTDTVTNATVTEVFPVNIPSIVGSNTAWVGFTGGTGGFSATQNVLSWSYSAQ